MDITDQQTNLPQDYKAIALRMNHEQSKTVKKLWNLEAMIEEIVMGEAILVNLLIEAATSTVDVSDNIRRNGGWQQDPWADENSEKM